MSKLKIVIADNESIIRMDLKEMLEEAEYSFAMANAKESVKEASDYAIGSNNDQAVLDAIDWMIHKEKMFQK